MAFEMTVYVVCDDGNKGLKLLSEQGSRNVGLRCANPTYGYFV